MPKIAIKRQKQQNSPKNAGDQGKLPEKAKNCQMLQKVAKIVQNSRKTTNLQQLVVSSCYST